MDKLSDDLEGPLVQLLLSVADDKFMLGHHNADWTGLAPILEEDIALSALAQDEMAHAQVLYQMVAGLLGNTTADKLAYGRRPEEYRCTAVTEMSTGLDWAMTLARNFFCDHFDFLRLHRLAESAYTPLAQLSGRLAAEEQIHVEHVDSWLKRLGRGGAEAHDRMQDALDRLAELAVMLAEPTEGLEVLESQGIYPNTAPGMFECWSADLQRVSQEAGLSLTVSPLPARVGGRRGRRSLDFESLLDELTEVYRLEPEAAW